MDNQGVVETNAEGRIPADKMVETVFGWIQSGASSRRLQAYLDAKDWTPNQVISACGEVEHAVRAGTAELDDQARQVEFTLRIEQDSYEGTLQTQQELQQQGEQLAAMAERVIVFFRPRVDEAEVEEVEATSLAARLRGTRVVSFFRKEPLEPLSDIEKLPAIGEVQLPPVDDVYQEIPAVCLDGDPAVEQTEEWHTICEIAEEEKSSPERELANVGRTYEELRPYWERAKLMGTRQVEQSKGIITALAAHWTRIQEAVQKQKAAIEQQRSKFVGYEQACAKVREALYFAL